MNDDANRIKDLKVGGGIEPFNTLKKALSWNVCFDFSDEYKINMN